jgi:hypothetical protein
MNCAFLVSTQSVRPESAPFHDVTCTELPAVLRRMNP